MKNKAEYLIYLFFMVLFFGGGFIIGYKANEPKEITTTSIDILSAKLDSLQAKKDTTINHFETKITNEKTIINNTFNRIDSLTFDSAYSLWTAEARQYQPIFN
jgi:hypothetical protein